MAGGRGRQKPRQVAALPLRLGSAGVVETLLVTSRRTRRWVLPKGNLMKGVRDAKVAAIEAVEEAGLLGTVAAKPCGSYDYWKRRAFTFELCQVDVYLMLVEGTADTWKEKGQRERSWVPLKLAARMVLEPALQTIFRQLDQEAGLPSELARPSGGKRAAAKSEAGQRFQAA